MRRFLIQKVSYNLQISGSRLRNKMRIPKTPTKKEDIMQILTETQGSGMILNESSQIV